MNLYATSGCLKALDVFKDLFQQSLRVSIVYKVQETPPPTPPTPTGLYIRNDSVLHNERICGEKIRDCDSTRAYTTQAVACERDYKLD